MSRATLLTLIAMLTLPLLLWGCPETSGDHVGGVVTVTLTPVVD